MERIACAALGGPNWKDSRAYGLQGMLRMGEWASKASAMPYASRDEQVAVSLALHIADASDDEL